MQSAATADARPVDQRDERQELVQLMPWKRFLYKQLYEAEGIYTCRSPSCEVCRDYHVCLGPEQ